MKNLAQRSFVILISFFVLSGTIAISKQNIEASNLENKQNIEAFNDNNCVLPEGSVFSSTMSVVLDNDNNPIANQLPEIQVIAERGNSR